MDREVVVAEEVSVVAGEVATAEAVEDLDEEEEEGEETEDEEDMAEVLEVDEDLGEVVHIRTGIHVDNCTENSFQNVNSKDHLYETVSYDTLNLITPV